MKIFFIVNAFLSIISMFLIMGTGICSSKPAATDVIGIDLGTTNSCVAVMEGKVTPLLVL